ncbi:hypothetical protein [Alkalibacter saccharofermentans]|uniref:DUF4878 domain-containing protein n=1 Tax=Alkalibacter saccharofermentans DSM 14828 TaxID=1120975 RepID=A0A1M4ZU04_9FIRM|nr:hypothetical protein [Alkalibacter saccharofermentans]SHF21096.1 hypothetical protein SAMN02746064_02135 [Alkalibacter saccharofermentans DSM 14828]
MKKNVILLLIVVVVILITGCSNAPKPETTVEGFLEASKELDIVKMAEFVEKSEIEDQEIFDEFEEIEEGSLEASFMDYLKENASKMTYDISGSTVEDDKATVDVDVKYVDGGSVMKATIVEVFTKVFAGAFAGVEYSEEETNQIFISELNNQREKITETFVEKSIRIDCVLIDDKWYITNLDTEILDVILSNFVSVSEELDEDFSDEE